VLQTEAETTEGELCRRSEQRHVGFDTLSADDFDEFPEAVA
jgi:hypothetical protein